MSYRRHDIYDPSEVDDFRSLRGKGGHFAKGLFIAEGPKITRKVIASNFSIASALMTPEFFELHKPEFERRSDTTDVYLAQKEDMEHVVGYPLHQGIMLAVRIPESRTLAQLIAVWNAPLLIVALDSIADAENMGAIIRNAAAFGVAAILVDDQSCTPFLRRSVRVSMGTILDIEIVCVPDLAAALKELKALTSCNVIGAVLGPSSVDLDNAFVSGATVLVFGSEGWGLRKEVVDACDILVQIPIAPHIDSLNVAIASGIFMHKFSRVSVKR